MTILKQMTMGVAAVVMVASVVVAAGTAKGTATYKGKKGPIVVAFTHAALVSGPDAVSGKPMRRLVLSTKDVSGAIAKCTSMMSCSDGGIVEGMTVDLLDEPRWGYWFVANGQLVQYSGMIKPAEAALTTDTPTRIAGTLTFDQAASGGATVSVTFDAPLVKTLGK